MSRKLLRSVTRVSLNQLIIKLLANEIASLSVKVRNECSLLIDCNSGPAAAANFQILRQIPS